MRRALDGLMRTLITLALLAIALPALAQEPPQYLDDRSTPQAVVQSYYNAINRTERARAHSYYHPGNAPPYEDWAAGYAHTASVELVLGEVSAEGAAGSTYYNLPVALAATSDTGAVTRFSGCYILRLVNPGVQSVPFSPMHIEQAHLEPLDGPLTPPVSCDP